MKKIFTLFFLTIGVCFGVLGQTGVKTKAPKAVLHIDGAKDNGNTIGASQAKNDVVFTEDGYLGVGVLAPNTRVDIRSEENTSIVGIGQTSQSASQVGPGVLRYNSTAKVMEYSDGVNWYPLSDKAPEKVVVIATKTSSQNFSNNASTTVTGFNEVEDNYNAFNPSTGIFTAPREGYYYVSFNLTFQSGNVNNNSYVESVIVSDNSDNNIREYRGLNSFPGFENHYNPSIEVGMNASALFSLKEGSTVYFRVYSTLGNTKNNTSNAGENRISIIEI
ncbi:C1q-like domain-containing protein [Myroides sp. LJL116]